MFLFSFLVAQNEKCGTYYQVERHWKSKLLKIEENKEIRPVLQKSILTPNNKIRIHFDTIGINQPAMVDAGGNRLPNSYQQFIDTVRIILDSVWNAEIIAYKFNSPPSDNGRGGDDAYDFYIINYNDGTFGITNIENDLPVGPVKSNQQYASFIQIDNDFGVGYRTKGIPAVMATCAHEFHHAIQVGGTGVWENQYFYFYELCAEAMENIVFKEARDYIFDVKTYFANISATSLFQQRNDFSTAGYERAIWGMFLMKKYGTGIMKEMWDEMKTNRPVQASSNALNTFSTSIQREFSDFIYWNYYTGHRAVGSKYHLDAESLPLVSLTRSITIGTTNQVVQINTKSFTANYIKVSTLSDSAFVLVSNTNFTDAVNYSQQIFPFQLTFSSSSSSGFPAISNSVYGNFQTENILDWSYYAIGTTLVPNCFPNPFNPTSSSLLIALQGISNDSHALINIFAASTMDMIYSGNIKYKSFSGIQYAEWSGRDNKGGIVASGVYIYVLSNGIVFNKGKFVVIR